jgi:hypothetical protein
LGCHRVFLPGPSGDHPLPTSEFGLSPVEDHSRCLSTVHWDNLLGRMGTDLCVSRRLLPTKMRLAMSLRPEIVPRQESSIVALWSPYGVMRRAIMLNLSAVKNGNPRTRTASPFVSACDRLWSRSERVLRRRPARPAMKERVAAIQLSSFPAGRSPRPTAEFRALPSRASW